MDSIVVTLGESTHALMSSLNLDLPMKRRLKSVTRSYSNLRWAAGPGGYKFAGDADQIGEVPFAFRNWPPHHAPHPSRSVSFVSAGPSATTMPSTISQPVPRRTTCARCFHRPSSSRMVVGVTGWPFTDKSVLPSTVAPSGDVVFTTARCTCHLRTRPRAARAGCRPCTYRVSRPSDCGLPGRRT